MSDENGCKLTGRRCYRTIYGDERCSDHPGPDDVSACIQTLDEKREELEKELADMDAWVQNIKDHATKVDKSDTHH